MTTLSDQIIPMISNLCDDINNHILSFLIGPSDVQKYKDLNYIDINNMTKIKYLTNDTYFLRLTSKKWNILINKYIKHYYKNTILYFYNKINYDANFHEALKNVTLEDVKTVAEKYMAIKNPVTVIVR